MCLFFIKPIMNTLIELQYFPPIAYFATLMKQDNIHIEQYENYQKGSYRNRCEIATANGSLRLTIPLKKGKNNQTSIKDVKIYNETNWQIQHWRAIKAAYGKSPFFEFYADELNPFFHKEYDFLFDWNIEMLNCIIENLNLPIDYQLTTDYQLSNDNIIDFRNKITPKKDTTSIYKPVPYGQVFLEKHGFLPNLSILDLLFCKGPEAILTIANY